MTKLPRGLSGKQVVKALQRAGFYMKRRKITAAKNDYNARGCKEPAFT
jgi:hypothetical protein